MAAARRPVFSVILHDVSMRMRATTERNSQAAGEAITLDANANIYVSYHESRQNREAEDPEFF